MGKRRVCVVLVDRANYGRMQPVMEAIQAHAELELLVAAAGSMVLKRFGRPVDGVREAGFPVASEIYLELEGSVPTTMAKSIGFGIVEFASEFQRLQPDVVLLIGDRYEALSAAIAAAYMNLCIAHIQGGEISGSIDESARHAISKFAHFHFPSTERAAENLIRMGERRDTILSIGCPSSDLADSLSLTPPEAAVHRQGSGASLSMNEPYLLAVFHPTTTEYGGETQQMDALLMALNRLRLPTLVLWPNIDAGSDGVSKAIRLFRANTETDWLRVIINLSPDEYLQTLACAACAVGNSSSFVRDGSYFGTPVVLVGNRQQGREHDEHVSKCPLDSERIEQTIRSQLAHGRYEPSRLYGAGKVGPAIAESLARLRPYLQKQLVVPDEVSPGE